MIGRIFQALPTQTNTTTVAFPGVTENDLLWAGVCLGRLALPCPCPALFVTTDKQTPCCFYIYLYNIPGWSSFSSICPVVHPVIHPFLHPSKAKSERRMTIHDDCNTSAHKAWPTWFPQNLSKRLAKKLLLWSSIPTKTPKSMNKAKMHNVLERNKLEEDQMLIYNILL